MAEGITSLLTRINLATEAAKKTQIQTSIVEDSILKIKY